MDTKNFTLSLPDLPATKAVAQAIAKSLRAGLTLYLHGDLGVGKSTLVRELLAGLGHTGAAKSPTYTLVETYTIAGLTINHFDLYRLTDPMELEFIGIRDYITPEAVNFFEWADKGRGYVPTADIVLDFIFVEDGREVAFTANTALGATFLQALQQINL